VVRVGNFDLKFASQLDLAVSLDLSQFCIEADQAAGEVLESCHSLPVCCTARVGLCRQNSESRSGE
jgi:hypothetical protein